MISPACCKDAARLVIHCCRLFFDAAVMSISSAYMTMLQLGFRGVLLRRKSMVSAQSVGDMGHPCLTPFVELNVPGSEYPST